MRTALTRFLALTTAMAAGLTPARALDLGGSKVLTPQLQKTLILQIPAISSVSPGCVKKGGTLTVLGSNFGTQTGRAVAISGPSHVDLQTTYWSASKITAIVPNTGQVLAGKTYSVGIERSGHAGWLSNTNISVTICSALTILKPGLITPAIKPGIGGFKAPLSPGVTPGPGGEPVPEGGMEPGGMGMDPGGAPMPGGPGLLDSQLPPPPADLPPPPPRHDKRSEPGEIVVVSANMAEARVLQQHARNLGLGVKRRTILKELGLVVTVLRVPREVSVGNAIQSLRQVQPNIWVDANHRLGLHGASSANFGQPLVGSTKPVPACGSGIRIGLIDTVVDTTHPSLKGRAIIIKSFLTTGVKPAAADHGTATAALLVGRPQSNGFRGLVPGARLYAASVFRHQDDRGADATAETVVKALNWLASQHVQIINMNFGGQRNLLLEAAIDRLQKRGIVVVVAVGNNGSDQPTWPAAQKGVVSVTAVDAGKKIYEKANRGKHIDFAAPGVDVWSASAGGKGKTYTGTSYAAPFVTAALAMARQQSPKSSWPSLLRTLQSSAIDLGDKGRDPVYGWGLIQVPARCRGR